MWSRIVLLSVTLFWLVMSGLLWYSELGGGEHIGSRLPPAQVWQRLLKCPNTSNLEIRRGTNRLGTCRWNAVILTQSRDDAPPNEDLLNEGAVDQITGYAVDLNGHLLIQGFPAAVRFDYHLDLDAQEQWQRLAVEVKLGADKYGLHADAQSQTVRLVADDLEGRQEHAYTFDELRRPQRLLSDLGGSLLPTALSGLRLSLSTNQLTRFAGGLQWEARMSSVKVGHSPLRAYRLRAKLFDRWQVTVFVNAIGEIVRIELPERLVLVNEGINSAAPLP